MSELRPLPSPKGIGKDGPKEINHDGKQKALEEIPPIISPQPEIRYLYNKVTKYMNGHRIEFNTTEGHEYINIQHGNDETRITLFADGNIEIIQKDGNRLDQVSGDYRISVGNDFTETSDTRLLSQKNYLSDSEGVTYIKSKEIIVLDAPLIVLKGKLATMPADAPESEEKNKYEAQAENVDKKPWEQDGKGIDV